MKWNESPTFEQTAKRLGGWLASRHLPIYIGNGIPTHTLIGRPIHTHVVGRPNRALHGMDRLHIKPVFTGNRHHDIVKDDRF